jgi:hypothetical protein
MAVPFLKAIASPTLFEATSREQKFSIHFPLWFAYCFFHPFACPFALLPE